MQRLVEPASDPPPAEGPTGRAGRLRLDPAAEPTAVPSLPSPGRREVALCPDAGAAASDDFGAPTRLRRHREPVHVPGLAQAGPPPRRSFGRPGGGPPRPSWPGASWWPRPLVVVRHSARLYLSADAGHYLADADAVFGDGVRASRHLPVFPVLLGLLRFATDDLGAVVLGMAAVVVVMAAGFYVFVKGRLGAPLAEMVGVVSFVLAPVMAEGVAWYGASMMLGLGLSLFAMRLVDDAVDTPVAVAGGGGRCRVRAGRAHPSRSPSCCWPRSASSSAWP